MIPIGSTVIVRAEATIGEYLPRIGAALALLILGYIVGWLAGRIVAKTLSKIGLDDLANRVGIQRELDRFGFGRSASRLLGSCVRIALTAIAVIAAISALGLSALDDSLNAAVLFLPKLFAAFIIALAGLVVARFVRDRVEQTATRMDLGGPLGALSEGAIIAIFFATALAQLSVPLAALTLIVAIVIGAVMLSVALAFGLGSRETAGQIAAGRTLAGSLIIGQQITIGEIHGSVHAFESAATLLRARDGALVRIPNSTLLNSIVLIHEVEDEL